MGCRGDRAATGKSSRSIELGGLVGGAATACRGILSRRCCSVTLVKGTRATIRLRVKAHRAVDARSAKILATRVKSILTSRCRPCSW
jgi:hypothetical protein